jgi:small subunit ribosomal protein S24e
MWKSGGTSAQLSLHGSNRNCAHRTTVFLDIDPPVFGVGDHVNKKDSISLAALSALYQLHELKIVC